MTWTKLLEVQIIFRAQNGLCAQNQCNHSMPSFWTRIFLCLSLIGDEGATMDNWFCHTPICCPSRAQLLTSRYFHNIKNEHANQPGCMSVKVSSPQTTLQMNSISISSSVRGGHQLDRTFLDWKILRLKVPEGVWCPQHNPSHKSSLSPTVFFFFPQAGYTVGVFGKHLNNMNPNCPPPGVDRWLVNNGGNYLNPTFQYASAGVKPSMANFNNCTGMACYSTSVIGNATISWIKAHLAQKDSTLDQGTQEESKPFMAYVAVKAPHIQAPPSRNSYLHSPCDN